MPSLENWDGGLKSLLWLANSPHTPVYMYMYMQVYGSCYFHPYTVDHRSTTTISSGSESLPTRYWPYVYKILVHMYIHVCICICGERILVL